LLTFDPYKTERIIGDGVAVEEEGKWKAGRGEGGGRRERRQERRRMRGRMGGGGGGEEDGWRRE
jgi:hypothetical protein